MNKKDFETVDQLLSAIKPIKNLYHSHNEYIEIESLWPLISKPGVMHSSTKAIIELAFDHGGYIAGGFGRWAATSNRQVIERGEYAASGGDIDLFFNTQEGWKSFVRCIDTLKLNNTLIDTMTTSKGNLAVDFTVKKQDREHKYNSPPKMQAIGCITGTPVQVMCTFDFVNCMFAITRENTYAASNALTLENEKVLGISSWSNSSLVHRLSKYKIKYGFNKSRDLSENKRIEQLYNAVDHINKNKDLHYSFRFASLWTSFLVDINDTFFENSSIINDILSCIIIPLDYDGKLTPLFVNLMENKKRRFQEFNSNFQHMQPIIGMYQIGLENLSRREQKAKSISIDQYNILLKNLISDIQHYGEMTGYSQLQLDHPSWTAEQYCWSA